MSKRTFYITEALTFDQKEDLISLFKDKSLNIKIDELDCSVSFARTKSNLTFDDAIKSFDPSSFISVVLNEELDYFSELNDITAELCLRMKNKSTSKYSEIFIWIYVKKEVFLNEILVKTNLSPY